MLAVNTHTTSPLQVWHLRWQSDDAQCFVEHTPRGPEGQYLLNGRMLVSYRFATTDELFEWVTTRRSTLESRGWRSIDEAA
jgi:hypothetical protein